MPKSAKSSRPFLVRWGSPQQRVYLLLGGALVAVGLFHLGPVLLVGLAFYTVLDQIQRLLSKFLGRGMARYASLAIFLVVFIIVVFILAKFVRQSISAVPAILAKLIPALNQFSDRFGFDFQFDNVGELQAALMATFRENLGTITRSGQGLTKEAFKIFLGGMAAVFYFMGGSQALGGSSLYTVLAVEMERQVHRFLTSFGLVVGAQVVISGINTSVTFIFLTAVGMPYVLFLVLTTFLSGLLPIIGNLISSTIIVGTALTVSPHLALLSLVYLVVIHKAEYFMNSRIVGSKVEMPMWQILVAIVLGEATLGLAGIPLAPAILHFARREMLEMKT